MSLKSNRTAVVMIETLAAMAVMAVLLVFVGQWSVAMLQHRRTMVRQQTALRAMDNVITVTMAAEFEDVNVDNLLSLAQAHTPPQSQWDIRVDPEPSPGTSNSGKKITVGLTYKTTTPHSARLVVWRYPARDGGDDE